MRTFPKSPTPKSYRAGLFVILAAWLFVTSTGHADTGMRCGKRLVSLGDHITTVLDKCGDPDYSEQRKTYRTIQIRRFGVWVEESVEINIEELTYDMGRRHFIRHAIFENSRLVDVTTGPKGRKD